MSSTDNSQNSAIAEQNSAMGSLQLPGLVSQLSPADQLPFPEHTPAPVGAPSPEYPFSPVVIRPLTRPITSPGVTRRLGEYNTPPPVTHNLPEIQTDQLLSPGTTTAFRQPIVIRGTGKKSSGTMRPPKGRRWVVHTTVTMLFLLITVGTFLAVLPVGSDGHGGFNPFRSVINLWQSNGEGGSTSLIAQRAATATAGTQQDGCETCSQNNAPPAGDTSGDAFTYGQCTYWADLRYHQLTGYWIPWGGNAGEWAYNASYYTKSGWIISATPHVPSIIVLAPYVQGAGGYGHVAVVESINPDGSVHTSNWNWYANGGGWATKSYWDFMPGPGVTFIWHV